MSSLSPGEDAQSCSKGPAWEPVISTQLLA